MHQNNKPHGGTFLALQCQSSPTWLRQSSASQKIGTQISSRSLSTYGFFRSRPCMAVKVSAVSLLLSVEVNRSWRLVLETTPVCWFCKTRNPPWNSLKRFKLHIVRAIVPLRATSSTKRSFSAVRYKHPLFRTPNYQKTQAWSALVLFKELN